MRFVVIKQGPEYNSWYEKILTNNGNDIAIDQFLSYQEMATHLRCYEISNKKLMEISKMNNKQLIQENNTELGELIRDKYGLLFLKERIEMLDPVLMSFYVLMLLQNYVIEYNKLHDDTFKITGV